MNAGRLVILGVVLLALLGLGLLPAAAQSSNANWQTELFNNPYLIGQPNATRTDRSIAFDWGSGSPQAGINADGFSIRFGTDVFFEAGTYRFWVLADDRAKIWIDFGYTPMIDTFANPSVGRLVSADVQLTRGTHHIQVDFAEETGNAYLYVAWANLATNPTGPGFPTAPPISNPFPVSGPWTAEYYPNLTLSGAPALIQSEPVLTRNWGNGSPTVSIPSDNWSARWTSVQSLPAGVYQLTVRADDGVRVTINGSRIIDEWHGATGGTYTNSLYLYGGQHSFLVEFYEASGIAFLEYTFAPVGVTATATPPPVITGAFATVTGAFRLNVRSEPNAISGQVLTRINRNETYAVVGRNAASSWLQLNVNGVVGWVNARFVTAVNLAGVPVTSGAVVVVPPTAPPATIACTTAPVPRLRVGNYGRVTPGLPNNVRASADVNAVLIGQIPAEGIFYVMNGPVCASGFYWWQVSYGSITGWTPEGGSGQYWVAPF